MKRIYCLLCCLSAACLLQAQLKKYKVCVIAFYNLENLYDTTDNPMVNDDEFTPGGDKQYTGMIYRDKLGKLATVISQIGTDVTPEGPTLLGVAEIENDTVLNDLLHHTSLQNRQYRFIHYDSKDSRGIDVALVYRPGHFTPLSSEKITVALPGNSKDFRYTRDILYVKGLLDGETIHVYVNHWPSRRGGEDRSSPAREAAAATCRQHLDKLRETEPAAKCIVMGDLNDDPVNRSITRVLKAKGSKKHMQPGDLFNPWTNMYLEGIGTLANRDSWSLFDQILFSESWLTRKQKGFYFYRQYIYNKPYMVENSGRFKGYPMRTWEGNRYRGGYSDHFPVYLILLKQLN